jgi:hypothetical protein
MGKWSDRANAAKPKGGGDGKYVKLADGDTIEFAVTDSDVGQESSWWKDGAKVEPDTKGARLDTKIMLCVYDVQQKKMRILRLTPTAFSELSAKLDRFGEDYIWELKRTKEKGKDFVSYKVERLDKLTPEQKQAIARDEPYDVLSERGVVPLPVVESNASEPMPMDPPQGEQQPADEDVPF